MTRTANSVVTKYWIVANFFAMLVGITICLTLSSPAPNPVIDNVEHFRVVSRIGHYLFHPATYMLIVALFVVRIIQMKFVGFWSIFFSFIVGGLATTVILSL